MTLNSPFRIAVLWGGTHLYLQLSIVLGLLHRRKHTDQENKGEWEKKWTGEETEELVVANIRDVLLLGWF